MNNKFVCPSCRTLLNVGNHIVFTAENSKKQKGLLLLSTELGNYQILHDPGFEYQGGDHVDCYCPVCNYNLGIQDVNEDLAEILMIDKNNDEFKIVFSEIVGKEFTIKIKNNTIVESFGDDSDEFQNFWGTGPNY